MNYENQIKEKLENYDRVVIDYKVVLYLLYNLKRSVNICIVNGYKYGLCHFVDTITIESELSLLDSNKYYNFLVHMLPKRGYTPDGISTYGGVYGFPIKMDGESSIIEAFYHYRLMWIRQFIKIIEDELQKGDQG